MCLPALALVPGMMASAASAAGSAIAATAGSVMSTLGGLVGIGSGAGAAGGAAGAAGAASAAATTSAVGAAGGLGSGATATAAGAATTAAAAEAAAAGASTGMNLLGAAKTAAEIGAAASAIYGGVAANDQAKQAARQTEYEGKAEADAANARATRIRAQGARFLAEQRSRIGAGGIESGSGSALDVGAFDAGQVELDALTQVFGGTSAHMAAMNRAKMQRAGGRAALIGGTIGGVSGLLSSERLWPGLGRKSGFADG